LTPAANQAADIYSTGIIFHEILHRNGPFGVECMGLSTFGKIKNRILPIYHMLPKENELIEAITKYIIHT